MTIEQLEKANAINDALKEYKDFLKAFDSPFSNQIKSHNYDGQRSLSQVVILENHKALSDIIRRYITDQIAALEKELEEL